MNRTVGVGLLGCGNVGAEFARLLLERRDAIVTQTDIDLQLRRIAVKSLDKPRPAEVDPAIFTDDTLSVVHADDVDVLVEIIGGIEPAKTFVSEALRAGKSVITGNKELIATAGAELFALANETGSDLLFETAVVAAVPIVRPLRESLLAEEITLVAGIINGTSNYILTKMSQEGSSFADALAEAQELGYAEPDPTADISGADAAAKLSILASIAFNTQFDITDVVCEGISDLTEHDFRLADRMGCVIKLLGVAERGPSSSATLTVAPTLVPRSHPLASVNGTFNAVLVHGEASGELLFFGTGAGARPSASALLGDVLDAADNLVRGTFHKVPVGDRHGLLAEPSSAESEFLISLTVDDEPGVLAEITGLLGQSKISVERLEQLNRGRHADLVFVTHRVAGANVTEAVQQLNSLSCVTKVGRVMRVFTG